MGMFKTTHFALKKVQAHEESSLVDVEAEENQEAPVPIVTHVNNCFCSQFFLMLKCTSTISKYTTLKDCICTSLTFPTFSRKSSVNTGDFRIARGTTMKNILMKVWKRLCPNHFSRGE